MGKRPFLPLHILIFLLYGLLTGSYSLINPLFEAPDEHWHYFTAQAIAETGQLPVVGKGDSYDAWLSQEAAQPPLYYIIGSLLLRLLDVSQAREQVWLNPQAWIGNGSALTNVNRMVHTAVEGWPWRGYVLGAHLLRGFSLLLGLGTLLCIYGSGRLLWPMDGQRPLLAIVFVAFLPQFAFIHSAISNDSLITFLASATLWQLLWLWHHTLTPGRLLLVGLTIGLAALSKNAGILLLVYAVVFLLVCSWQQIPRQKLRQTMLLTVPRLFLGVVLPVLLLAGWLWWRNWMLYGDLTATSVFIDIAGGDREYTLAEVLGERDGLWKSLFAVFGWFNLLPPAGIYILWNGLVGLGVLGAVVPFSKMFAGAGLPRLKTAQWLLPLLLLGWVLAVCAGLFNFMRYTEAAQGRLLFPAILPLALGLAYGLSRWRRAIQWLAVLAALGSTLYCLFFVIRPAYALPTTVATLPETAVPLQARMGQGLTLVGAEVETTTAVPGDPVTMTLYWQADPVPDKAPELVLELFGRDSALISQLQTYHGRGLYPANLWPAGRLVADRFSVRLDKRLAAPVQGQIFVGLRGEEARVSVGAVKINPIIWPNPAGPVRAQLGEGIGLTAVAPKQTRAQPGETVTITVQWQVLAVPPANYTTLIHLGASGRPPLAQGDSPPLRSSYPTQLWQPGEVIDDVYLLTIPADLPNGRYPLWLGLYQLDTGLRLPLFVANTRQPNDTYLIDWLEIHR